VIPFDSYSLRSFAAAIDPTTNLSVYIAWFVVTTPLGSFEILSCDTGTIESTPYLVLRSLSAVIKRSTISRMFTLSLALFNWFLTIGMIYTTALVIFGKVEASSTVAFMPFSMMLTIPAVRGLYADPPSLAASFGTLRTPQSISPPFDPLYTDTAGFFVQLLFIGCCELALLRKLTLHKSASSRDDPARAVSGYRIPADHPVCLN